MINWDYQKALDRINHNMWNQDMETTEYVATLQDALGKQIGKKAIKHDGTFYSCPECDCQVDRNFEQYFNGYSYCQVCGQKLEW